MALHRFTEVSAYIRYIRDHPPEVTALCQDLLIHVTRFFRDPESFNVLKASALAEIAAQKSDDPIRVWVAGCATGEESYSVAIVLMEMLGDRMAERKVQIFGTDVSESAVDVARSGTYPATITADVSPERLKRFFTKAGGDYRVAKVLRDVCIFCATRSRARPTVLAPRSHRVPQCADLSRRRPAEARDIGVSVRAQNAWSLDARRR